MKYNIFYYFVSSILTRKEIKARNPKEATLKGLATPDIDRQKLMEKLFPPVVKVRGQEAKNSKEATDKGTLAKPFEFSTMEHPIILSVAVDKQKESSLVLIKGYDRAKEIKRLKELPFYGQLEKVLDVLEVKSIEQFKEALLLQE